MDLAEQLMQAFRVVRGLLQFDQQLFAALELLGGFLAKVVQQVAGYFGEGWLGHGRSPVVRTLSIESLGESAWAGGCKWRLNHI